MKQLQRKQYFEEDRLDKLNKKQDRFLTQLNVDLEFDKFTEKIELTVEKKIASTLHRFVDKFSNVADKTWVESELAKTVSESSLYKLR